MMQIKSVLLWLIIHSVNLKQQCLLLFDCLHNGDFESRDTNYWQISKKNENPFMPIGLLICIIISPGVRFVYGE